VRKEQPGAVSHLPHSIPGSSRTKYLRSREQFLHEDVVSLSESSLPPCVFLHHVCAESSLAVAQIGK